MLDYNIRCMEYIVNMSVQCSLLVQKEYRNARFRSSLIQALLTASRLGSRW